ncbi:MAG: acyl-CoA dehydrogenase family protein [Panacagrimonas sp.]
MNATTEMLVDAAGHILSDLCTVECQHAAEHGTWPQPLWSALHDCGIAAAAWPESLDGSGLDMGDAVALLRVAGYHAAPVPLAEHWLAGQALAAANLAPGAGVLGLALPTAGAATVSRVPWARRLEVVAITESPEETRLRVYPRPRVAAQATSLAGEPCDTLDLAGSGTSADRLLTNAAPGWRARAALLRSAQMAGAMRRCLELTLTYASERKQFGRPLAAFQAIQQKLALLAAEVCAVEMAVESAAHAARGGEGLYEIAVAKARAGMAVEPVTRIAHQVHGAMGFTQEHRLHLYTRRLWSWRDDYGTETEWNALLGRRALELGGAGLWPLLASLGV